MAKSNIDGIFASDAVAENYCLQKGVKMIDFGPAGICDKMAAQNIASSDIPAVLHKLGITTFEYPLTYGTNISKEKATELGKKFKEFGISLSVHAPYYINLANTSDEMAEKSFGYIISSIKIMKAMGADRLVFHPGALMGQTRQEAQAQIIKRLKILLERLEDQDLLDGIYLCPETMGKHGQCGTVSEVAEMCALSEHLMPTIDFGHVNAFTLGQLDSKNAFVDIFKTLTETLGERGKLIHGHFSRIEFGAKGEIKHLNFDSDLPFGPDYRILNEALIECGVEGRIVCESRGHQTEDAITMKEDYLNRLNK